MCQKGQIRKSIVVFITFNYEGETIKHVGRGNFRKRKLTPMDFVFFFFFFFFFFLAITLILESSSKNDGILKDYFHEKMNLMTSISF